MKKYLYVFLVGIACFSCAIKSPDKLLERGIKRYNNSTNWHENNRVTKSRYRVNRAISDFTKAIQADSTMQEAWLWRGRANRSLRNYQDAISDYSMLIELDSNHAEAYYERGMTKFNFFYSSFGALEDLNSAIKNDTTMTKWYIDRARIKKNLGDLEGAIMDLNILQDFDLSIEQHPYLSIIIQKLKLRGSLKAQIGKYEEALNDFNEVIRISPHVMLIGTKTIMYKSILEQKLDMMVEETSNIFEESISSFNMQQDIERALVYIKAGNIFMELEEYDEAYDCYHFGAIANPSNPFPIMQQGMIRFKQNKHNQAIEHFTKAINIYPRYRQAYRQRGVAKQALEDYEEALNDINHAIEISRYSLNSFTARANLFLYLERHEEALSDFDKVLDVNQYHYEALIGRAQIKSLLGNHDEAIADYETALKVKPSEASLYYKIGRLKIKSGSIEDGCDYLNKAAELDYEKAFDVINDYCM